LIFIDTSTRFRLLRKLATSSITLLSSALESFQSNATKSLEHPQHLSAFPLRIMREKHRPMRRAAYWHSANIGLREKGKTVDVKYYTMELNNSHRRQSSDYVNAIARHLQTWKAL
jgi:hypothetical protein